jgi:hypothetical protein
MDVGSFDELAAFAATAKAKKPLGLIERTFEEEPEAPVASTSQLPDHANLGNDEDDADQRAARGDTEANDAPADYILAAGTSKRIWGELYKVIDSSDILLHVLDARDPIGTRCHSVEAYLAKEKKTKKVIYILNKVDLVPGWVAVSVYSTLKPPLHLPSSAVSVIFSAWTQILSPLFTRPCPSLSFTHTQLSSETTCQHAACKKTQIHHD